MLSFTVLRLQDLCLTDRLQSDEVREWQGSSPWFWCPEHSSIPSLLGCTFLLLKMLTTRSTASVYFGRTDWSPILRVGSPKTHLLLSVLSINYKFRDGRFLKPELRVRCLVIGESKTVYRKELKSNDQRSWHFILTTCNPIYRLT